MKTAKDKNDNSTISIIQEEEETAKLEEQEPKLWINHTFSLKFNDTTVPVEWRYLPEINCAGRRAVAIVSSDPSDKGRLARDAIRDTWMSSTYSGTVKNNTILALFIIGWSANETNMMDVHKEAEQFGDVIVISQPDSYRNLVIKVFSAMKYHQSFCKNVDYLFKVDHDVVFFPDHFFNLEREGYFHSTEAASYGNTWKKAVVERDPKNRWYTSYTQYPKDFYPTFTSGPAYILTKKAIPKLLGAAQYRNLVMVEDVFITGILAIDTKVKRISYPNFFYKYPRITNPKKFCSKEGKNRLISIHKYAFRRYRTTFHYLKNLNCKKLVKQR
ncbi:hypothetical protein WR25_00893 isoform B [Diploscapter pachys]|nr:hypothetical protein WR25_00893 isoform B [Diploscapter pachys]